MSHLEIFYKNNHSIVWTFIIAVCVNVYLYISYEPVSLRELAVNKGYLEGRVELAEHGGDMPVEFLVFKIEGLNRQFVISGCAYDLIDKDYMLQLAPGQLFEIYSKQISRKKSEVYQLVLSDIGTNVLDLDAYNNCESRQWLFFMPFVGLLAIYLIFKLAKTSSNKIVK